MVNNSRIEDLIRENRAEEIPEAIAEGVFFDMQTMSDALIDLVLSGTVDRETAANAAPNHHDFLVLLERAEKTQAANNARPPQQVDALGDGESGSAAAMPDEPTVLRLLGAEAHAYGPTV
jgi:Tfp pilus assembly ATPase PilU